MAERAAHGGDASVWVVDDDRAVRFVLATALREAGHAVREFGSAAGALAALRDGAPALIFTDVRMPGDDDGLALLRKLRAAHPALPVIVMSAYTDVASTAGAFRGGAWEFLSKPFDLDHAVELAARAAPLRSTSMPAQDSAGPPAPAAPPSAGTPELVGDTPAMRALFRSIGKLAQAPLSVLVTGETGTGKELVARALHRESPRAGKPFIALNTAAIPAELLESELFGHEAGAFTGATKRHVGRFEQADGGTLFLDEIGDMPAPLQVRLLRVLAEGEFFRVGGRELIRVDVVRLQVPPLRERRDDIPVLAERFLALAAQRLGAAPKRLLPEAAARLRAREWPGNVRELENACWRLAALAPDDRVGAADVDALVPAIAADPANAGAAPATVRANAHDWDAALAAWARARLDAGDGDLHARARERFEQALFDAALDHTGGHRGEAAARLGLGRNTLTRRLGPGRKRK